MESGSKLEGRLVLSLPARLGSILLPLAVFVFAPFLIAQDAAPAARAVRLGMVQGEVKISQGNQVLADPAPANSPLFEGAQIATGNDGQAEIQFEDGSVARLSPNSAMTLAVLRQQGNETEMVLDGGLGYFELQPAGNGQTRVRFGDSVVTASGFTVVRIDLDNLPGALAVFSGNAHLERANSLSLDLHGGESVALSAESANAYNEAEGIEPNSWDAWNADRDRALQSEYSAQTGATKDLAPNNNPAWADLDAYGNWYNVPDQGYVWSPNEAASPGWDPYGNGDWMWTPGYGYTWVSGESWGYTPYQCGMWNYYNSFGWGWAPGSGGCRPWWGTGGWKYRIGIRPPGYRYPVRPRPHPAQPGLASAHPMIDARGGAHPLVAVHRAPLPASDLAPRTRLAVIGDKPVQPMRPLAGRPMYNGAGNGFVGDRQGPGTNYRVWPAQGSNSGRPAYTQAPRGTAPALRPGYSAPNRPQPVYAPPARPSAPVGRAPSVAPLSAPSRPMGGGAPPAAPSHPMGGGGGGAPASHGGGPHR